MSDYPAPEFNGAETPAGDATAQPVSENVSPQAEPAGGQGDLWSKFTQALADFEQRQSRQFQSQLDKRFARIEKQLRPSPEAQAAQLAQRFGVPAEKQKDFTAAMQEMGLGKQPAADVEEAPAPDADPVTQAGAVLWQQLGLGPEDAALVKTNGTPQEYLASIVEAGKRKLQKAAPPNIGAAPAAVPNGNAAPRNPLKDITDPDALYALAAKEQRQKRRG